jgi:hypothetical protein
MKKINTIFLLVICIIVTEVGVNGAIYLNDLECIFSEDPEKTLIEDNVIAGAICFLHSESNADLILMEYEKSTRQVFNYSLVLEYVDKSIADLESAKIKYAKAIEIGERIGYIEEKLAWFKEYNYDTFIANNNLNKEIAANVMGYLNKADILGVYKHIIDDINELINILNSIRDKVKLNKKPDRSIFWALLQKYLDTTLFGNYSTSIGLDILNNCKE